MLLLLILSHNCCHNCCLFLDSDFCFVIWIGLYLPVLLVKKKKKRHSPKLLPSLLPDSILHHHQPGDRGNVCLPTGHSGSGPPILEAATVTMLNAKITQLPTTQAMPITKMTATSPLAPLLIGHPEKYSSKPAQCKWCLLQYVLCISLNEKEFQNNKKMAQFINLLKALTWAKKVWNWGGEHTLSNKQFIESFLQGFDHATERK